VDMGYCMLCFAFNFSDSNSMASYLEVADTEVDRLTLLTFIIVDR
jgi:hypothetical protein